MNPPLLASTDLVLRWDPEIGVVTFTSFRAGPAGMVSVPFAAADVTFDVAVAGQLNSVTLMNVANETELDAHRPLLDLLLEQITIAEIRAELGRSIDSPRRIVAPRSTRTRSDGDRIRLRDWSMLALALAQVWSPALFDEERDVQLLQAARIAASLEIFDQVDQLARATERAATRLSECSIVDLQSLDGRCDGGLRELLTAVMALVSPDTAVRLQRAIDLLRPSGGVDLSGVGRLDGSRRRLIMPSPPALRPKSDPVAPMPARSSARGEVEPQPAAMRPVPKAEPQPEVESPDSVNLLMGLSPLRIRRRDGDEYSAVLDGMGDRAATWWLRAFDSQGHVPISFAPFQPDGQGDAVATLLVAECYAEVVQWDVVDEPDRHRSSLPVATFSRAVATGVRAARAARQGDIDRAEMLWSECSRRHRDAGDTSRSKEAQAMTSKDARFGRGTGRGSREFDFIAYPLTTDRIITDIEAGRA